MEKVEYIGTSTSDDRDQSVNVSFLKIIHKIVIFVSRPAGGDKNETVILSDYEKI